MEKFKSKDEYYLSKIRKLQKENEELKRLIVKIVGNTEFYEAIKEAQELLKRYK